MTTTKHPTGRLILFLFLLSFISVACSISLVDTPPLPTVVPTNTLPGPGEVQVYFTDPSAPRARDYEGGPDEILAAAIDKARLSVDVAVYSFNLWSVRDALVHAYQRGVLVRMVMESDNMDSEEVDDLKNTGIPIVGDLREGLMHNKYVIIDQVDVWAGSMNYTAGGTYRDNNNLIHLNSAQAAEAYTQDFEEMFLNRHFGADLIPSTPHPSLAAKITPTAHPRVNIGGTELEIYFTPEQAAASRIIELVNGAEESINFLSYSFTSNGIGEAIRARALAGIEVSGVMDEGQSASDGAEYQNFLQAGLDVRLDGNSNGLMHHKVIIIDRRIVITGSYNFTAAAENTNDENLLIIFSPQLAEKYLEEYQRVYDETQTP